MSVLLALSMGEASSIGYEIACKAWQHYKNQTDIIFFIIAPYGYGGDEAHYATSIHDIAAIFPHALPILTMDDTVIDTITLGQPCVEHSHYSVQSIERAVNLARHNIIHAIVTLPIHKAIMQQGGFAFPGHTEFLGHLCNQPHPIMMLANNALRVIPLSVHVPLMNIMTHINKHLFHHVIDVAINFLHYNAHITHPRIAIAGLNPHAGEHGHIGTEEQEFIIPWINTFNAQYKGTISYDINGPLSADTLFHPKAITSYDIVLCWYHDQALIPVKTIDFAGSVNQTLGLPIIRTSPDHGTALDIAGHNKADATSLINAIKYAANTH